MHNRFLARLLTIELRHEICAILVKTIELYTDTPSLNTTMSRNVHVPSGEYTNMPVLFQTHHGYRLEQASESVLNHQHWWLYSIPEAVNNRDKPKSRLILPIPVSLISYWYLQSPAGGRSKKLGAFVKSKRYDNSGVAPLKEGGFLHSDPKAKANILNCQFTSVFSTDNGTPLPDLGDSHHPPMENVTVNENGVIKLLKNPKPFTASGPDGIPTMLLKQTAVEIAPAVTLLFQTSLDQGKVPSQWKKANIVPLFKKGSRSEAANYRPISLTSVLCKLCEHIIHCAVMQHLTNNNILSDAQFGSRKHRSCKTQLICMMDNLVTGLDNKSQIDVVLLDYEKAFDKVSHRHLLKKIEHNAIHL